MANSESQARERLTALQEENRRLKEQTRQAERVRRMWQDSAARLKEARRELLATRDDLSHANAELQVRLEELAQAKRIVEGLAYSDKQVIENMQEGLLVTDTKGTILAVNPAFTAITGFAAEEVIGRNPRLLQSGRHGPAFYQSLWQALLATGRWQGEVWNRRKSGELYPELLSISAIRDWGDDTINYIGVFSDLTEHERTASALRASQEQLEAVTSLLSEAVLLLDRDERIAFANPEATTLLRLPEEQLLGLSVREVVRIAEGRGPFLLPDSDHAELLTGDGHSLFEDVHLIRPDGSIVPVALATSSVVEDGQVVTAVVAFHDISRRKQAEDQLRKLSRAVEHSPSMVIITDLKGQVEYVNPRFTEITGYTPEEVIGRSTSLLKSGTTPPAVYADLWHTISGGHDWHGEFQNRRKNGEVYWQMVSISPIVNSEGAITHYVSVEEDITERKRNEEKIWRQANFDPLTGLPNRRLFLDRLRQAIAQAVRRGHLGALLFIDLDRFKFVNDTLGHEAGDALLRQISARLEHRVRETDTVARLGGDEFTVILPDAEDIDTTERVARKLLETIAQPVEIDGHDLFVSASIGVALFPDDSDKVDEVLKFADSAMYRAKERGRDTFAFYTEEINRESMRRMALESELRRALDRNELEVHYQPIMKPGARYPAGVEALLRWHNRNFGEVSPAEFIGIAESAGLMPAIGEWVLRTACRQAHRWRENHRLDLYVSVNLSLAQMRDESFIEHCLAILKETGLPPAALQLELTESIVMDNAEHYVGLLDRLAELGIKVALDDFGTGYSSFSYLKRLRASTLKIDQSFVSDLPDDPDDATIVRTIIQMAHNLNMQITAEGVERPEQMAFLREAGCDQCQGFLHAEPMSNTDFERYLRRTSSATVEMDE